MTSSYERLQEWIELRDDSLDHAIKTNQAPGIKFDDNRSSSTTAPGEDITYTLGALKLRGKVSQLNK